MFSLVLLTHTMAFPCFRLHSAGHLLDVCMRNVGLGHLEPGKAYHFPDGYDYAADCTMSYILGKNACD